MLEIGSIVDGKYKILNKIGQGGMSVVYLAMNERANKQWAIKEIRKDGVQNFEVVKQGLIVETGILKKLHHPNLPSIIDVIEDDGVFLIVMDYIEGNTLEKYLKTYGAQRQEDVIEWAKQLCDVLGYLHSRVPPIIYRDMKPSNIMLKSDGRVTLIDFGTAREFKSGNVADTTCLGTKGYAAPEQYGDRGQTDARTDIYCLGATLYHLITGHNPANPPYEMRPIREWNPLLSSGLEEIILKCTKADPAERYQDCAELMYALENYQELDAEKKRTRNMKWKTFIAVATSAVVFGLGATGFKLGENAFAANAYDTYMSQLSHETSVEKRTELIKSAINLAPERSEGYFALLENFYSKNDGERQLTKEEYKTISDIINENDGKKLSNIDHLQDEDRTAYCRFSLALGNAIYMKFNNNDEQGFDAVDESFAIQWFANAVTTNGLKGDELEEAKLMKDFSESYRKMTTLSLEVDYKKYWSDINKLVDEADKEKGQPIKQAGILKFVGSIISLNYYKFRNEGINTDKQQELVNKMFVIYNEIEEAYGGKGIDTLLTKTRATLMVADSKV